MTSIGQENLETVMIDFFGLLRRGDFDAAAALLDPDVMWQGLREDWVCHGPEEVLQTFRWGLEQRRDVDALVPRAPMITRSPARVNSKASRSRDRSSTSSPCARAGSFRASAWSRIDDYRRRSEACLAWRERTASGRRGG